MNSLDNSQDKLGEKIQETLNQSTYTSFLKPPSMQYPPSFMESVSSISKQQAHHKNQEIAIKYLPQQNKLVVKNPRPNLSYSAISTEPSRKFIRARKNNPESINSYKINEDLIEIQLVHNNNIPRHFERFLIIGYNLSRDVIEEVGQFNGCKEFQIQSKIQTLNPTLYISRNIAEFSCRSSDGVTIKAPSQLVASQIQMILEFIQANYGEFQRMEIKKNILILNFPCTNSTVMNKIKNPFIFQKKIRNKDKEGTLKLIKYFTITHHRPLFYTAPTKMIELPPETVILEAKIFLRWLVILTRNEAILMHLDFPLQNLITLPDFKVVDVFQVAKDKIAFLEHKHLCIYQISNQRKPKFETKIKISKLELYTLCLLPNNDLLLGGIDQSVVLGHRTSEKYVHVIKDFGKINLKGKQHVLIDSYMQICQQQKDWPILNLTHISSTDTFACSCGHNIFLAHFQTKTMLARVQLKASIMKISQIQYSINMANIMVLTGSESNKTKGQKQTIKNKENSKKQFNGIVRIGFDEYCGCIGTEVQNIPQYGQNIIDCYYSPKQILYVTDGCGIEGHKVNDNSNKTQVIVSEIEDLDKDDKVMSQNFEQGKIVKLAGTQDAIICCVNKPNLVQIYYIQI